jgi:hypothetical protein
MTSAQERLLRRIPPVTNGFLSDSVGLQLADFGARSACPLTDRILRRYIVYVVYIL